MRSWQVFVTQCLNNDIESYYTSTSARYLWGLQFVLDSRQLQFFVPYFAGDMLVQYSTDQWLTWLVRGECLTMRYLRPECPKNTITLILCQGRFRHCVSFVLLFPFFFFNMGHCHGSLEVIRSSLVENETWYLIKRQRFPLQTKTKTPNEFCPEKVFTLKCKFLECTASKPDNVGQSLSPFPPSRGVDVKKP